MDGSASNPTVAQLTHADLTLRFLLGFLGSALYRSEDFGLNRGRKRSDIIETT
jgi:hypothetical protein